MSAPAPDPKPAEPQAGAVVIGGGPAGLMAAEVIAAAGLPVSVFDAMPSVGRKFLLAGKGGLNLTHSEPRPGFDHRYGRREADVARWLDGFDGEALRAWAHALGVDTFVGSSGRVFPNDLKAAPLLRAWLHRLRGQGVRFHMRHRWSGWDAQGALVFTTPDGERRLSAGATVLALGGASWPQLGSDGAWVETLRSAGADVAPLQPANCGFDVRPPAWRAAAGLTGTGWTAHLAERHAGAPIKPVVLSVDREGREVFRRQGEFVLTGTGIEGSLVYAASAWLRDALAAQGETTLHLDLLPDRAADTVAAEVARPRGPRSLATHLRSRLGLAGAKLALLHEVLPRDVLDDPPRLAAAIKALPLRLAAPRPLGEAISTAGGVRLEALSDTLMLRCRPGLFCAGEMLDWEAPTGGYLLTACLASGLRAGQGAVDGLGAQAR